MNTTNSMLNTAKISYWERKNFFSECDLLVIGAGIVGYSTALQYKQQFPDARILILEQGILPSGASSKNAGFACFGSPTELLDDLQKFDAETVWSTVAKRMDGLRFLQETLGKDALDLQINGSWDLIRTDEEHISKEILEILPTLNSELKRICGDDSVFYWDLDVSRKFGFNGLLGGFQNKLEGQLDTAKMNAAFFQKVISKGISVLFSTEAREIESVGGACLVNTSIGALKTQKVAICTNGFAQQFLPKDDIKPARAQVLITEPIPNLNIKGTFHYQQGYYYFRNIDGRILLGGGRNLDYSGETTTELDTTDTIQSALKSLLSDIILPNTPFKIDHSWAGVMGVGSTKKPIIKELQPNVYCGVRLGGMGVAIGSLVGKELVTLMK